MQIEISDKPWNGGNGLAFQGGGSIVLDVESNWFGQCSAGYGLDLKEGAASSIEFKRSWCLTPDHQLSVRSGGQCTVEFHSTTQRVAQLGANSANAKSVMHGDEGAMVEIAGGCRAGSTEGFAGMINSVQVTGALGFHMTGTGIGYEKKGTVYAVDGTNAMFCLQSKAFQSSGPLEVSGGQLSLGSTASWKNGRSFVMRGTGQLRLAGTDQLSREFATLYFSEKGNLYLGGINYVHAAEVLVNDEWVSVPNGWYDVNTKTGPLAGRISGSGRLHIGEKGTMLLLR